MVGLGAAAGALEVDEKGTRAAAATAISVLGRAGPPGGEPLHLVFDRPFFCAIEHRRSGVLLFMGVVGDPRVSTRPAEPRK